MSTAKNDSPRRGVGRPSVLRAESPDPDAGTLLALYNVLAAKPLQRVGLRRARRSWRVLASAVGRARPVASVQSMPIEGPGGPMTLRVYRPVANAAPCPVFIWFHGGGFLMGSVDTADTICRHVARTSGAIVVAAPYRLVPEHDLYAGREDALAAIEWLLANAASIGIDPERLAVGGDSAGGNLAAVVAQHLAKRLGPALRLQVLAYPATNLRDDQPSKAENAHGYMLTSESIDWFKAMYSRGSPDLSDPRLSPMFAPDAAGLPPALVISAGFDPIRDDGLAYAEKLRQAKVPVQLLHYAGQFHGFLNFDAVLHGARDALDRIGGALREAFGDEGHTAPDRTLELATRPTWNLAGVQWTHTAVVASWMLAQRIEQGWARVLRGMVPLTAWTEAIDEHPLLNMAGALRAGQAACFAPLEAKETYTAPPGGENAAVPQGA